MKMRIVKLRIFCYSWALSLLTLTRPLCRKLRMRWFFDFSQVKESSFFKSDVTDPLSAHPLENTNLSPSSFHFSVAFITSSDRKLWKNYAFQTSIIKVWSWWNYFLFINLFCEKTAVIELSTPWPWKVCFWFMLSSKWENLRIFQWLRNCFQLFLDP